MPLRERKNTRRRSARRLRLPRSRNAHSSTIASASVANSQPSTIQTMRSRTRGGTLSSTASRLPCCAIMIKLDGDLVTCTEICVRFGLSRLSVSSARRFGLSRLSASSARRFGYMHGDLRLCLLCCSQFAVGTGCCGSATVQWGSATVHLDKFNK